MAVAAALALIVRPHAAAAAHVDMTIRCEVAKQVVRQVGGKTGKPWVFVDFEDDGAPGDLRYPSTIGDLMFPRSWRHRPPSIKLARRYLESRKMPGPLAMCPGFADFVRKLGGHAGQAALDRMAKQPDAYDQAGDLKMIWPYETQSTSIPVLSATGRDALVAVGGAGGNLAGAGFLWHLRRTRSGTWMRVDARGLWIS